MQFCIRLLKALVVATPHSNVMNPRGSGETVLFYLFYHHLILLTFQ